MSASLAGPQERKGIGYGILDFSHRSFCSVCHLHGLAGQEGQEASTCRAASGSVNNPAAAFAAAMADAAGQPSGRDQRTAGVQDPGNQGRAPAPGHVDTGGVYRESGAVLEEQRQRQQEEQAARQRHEAYEQAKRLEEARIRAEEQASYLRAAKLPQGEASGQQPFLPVLTPESAQQAVVLAELLGSPRAHRPGRWQRHRRHD